MKVWKRLTAITMIAIMAVSMLAGCGSKDGKKANGNREVIEIKMWRSGMGEEWLKQMIKAFEEENSKYAVEYVAYADASGVTTAFGQEDIDTTDIYFALGFQDNCATLDDVLDRKVDGESKTIREKFSAGFLNTLKWEDDTIHQLTYGGGVVGIVYNKKLFEKAGIKELPKTTNELVLVCDSLSRKDITPWCHFKQGGYWDMMTEVFAMQYDGFDYRNNVLYACTDEDGNSPSKDVLKRQDGRYKTLKMYESFLRPDYVLSGSNSDNHITMQTKFIHEQAAMMVNGTWMSNEMASVGTTENFGVMKAPVISSIVEKLTSVKKDSELSAVVEAVDAVTDGTKKIEDYKQGDAYVVDGLQVTADDWDKIFKARNTVGTNYGGCTAYIPEYSAELEGAKEFLQFMYSDKGLKIYAEATRTMLPVSLSEGEIDTSKWNSFQKENVTLMQTAEQFATSYVAKKHNIYDDGGVHTQFANQFYVQYLTALNEGDRKSADKIWNDIMDYIDSNYESVWLKNIE